MSIAINTVDAILSYMKQYLIFQAFMEKVKARVQFWYDNGWQLTYLKILLEFSTLGSTQASQGKRSAK
jgi:hypothetical protein